MQTTFDVQGIPITTIPNNQPGDYCTVYNTIAVCPNYTIVDDGTHIIIELDEDLESISNFSGSQTRTHRISKSILRTLPHELASWSLFGSSDVKLNNSNRWSRAPKHTPDFAFQSHQLISIELKTRQDGPPNDGLWRTAALAYDWTSLGYLAPWKSLGVGITPLGFCFDPELQPLISARGPDALKSFVFGLSVARRMNATDNYTNCMHQIPDLPLEDDSPDPVIITKEKVQKYAAPSSSTLVESLLNFGPLNIPSTPDPSLGEPTVLKSYRHNLPTWLSRNLKEPPIMASGAIHEAIINSVKNSLSNGEVSGKLYVDGSIIDVAVSEAGSIERGLWHKRIFPEDAVDNKFVGSQNKNKLSLAEASEIRKRFEHHPQYNDLKAMVTDFKERKHRENMPPTPLGNSLPDALFKVSVNDEETYSRVDGTEETLPFQEELWWHALKNAESVIAEINVGRAHYAKEWNKWNWVRLPDGSYLFRQSTGLFSPSFFFLVARGSPCLSGHKMIPCGNGWHISQNAGSFDEKKVSQYISICERLSAARSYLEETSDNSEIAAKRFTMILCCSLDGKQKTVDMMQLLRFYYMEQTTFAQNYRKLLSKVEGPLRTRVQCHIAHFLMTAGKSEMLIDEEGVIRARKLIDWSTGEPLSDFSQAIDLSYYHMVCPHANTDNMRGLVQIVKKILSQEVKMKDVRDEFTGESPCKDPSDLRPHEFCGATTAYLGTYLNSWLKKKYGDGVFSRIFETFKQRIDKLDWIDFCTMKKSTDLSSDQQSKRIYCFEAISKLMAEMNGMVYDFLEHFFRFSETDEGLVISIFKKDQASGVREICVLCITTRLIFKYLETFARVINEMLPNEMLSTPSDKASANSRHFQKVAMVRSAMSKDSKRVHEVCTFSSSSDAKTWCQQFIMPNFHTFYQGLLSSETDESRRFLSIQGRAFNLISRKEFLIDARLKEWLQTSDDHRIEDETLMLLKEIFNSDDHPLKGRWGFKNRSNMMQGIPHDTSSMLHAAYLLFCQDLYTNLLPKILEQQKVSCKVVCSTKCSSDDSSVLLSFIFDDSCPDAYRKCRVLGTKALWNLELSKRLVGITTSVEKSTISTVSSVEEFNSRFQVGSQVLPATIKFIWSIFSMGYHPNLAARVQAGFSSINSLYSEGVSCSMMSKLHILMKRFQNRMLMLHPTGFVHNRLNDSLFIELGCYLVPPTRLTGIIDFRTMLNLIISEKWKNWQDLLKMPLRAMGSEEIYSLNSAVFAADSHRNYRQMLTKQGVDRDQISEKIREDPVPVLLGNAPREIQLKIKLLSPGIKISMSFVSMAKIQAISCYSMTRPVITLPEGYVNPSLEFYESYTQEIERLKDERVPKSKWPSRLQFLPQVNKFNLDEAIAALNNSACRPYSFEDSEQVQVAKSLMAIKLKEVPYLFSRQRRNQARSLTGHIHQPYTVLDVMGRTWFSKRQFSGVKDAQHVMPEMKRAFPFLDDDIQATLDNIGTDWLGLIGLCRMSLDSECQIRFFAPTAPPSASSKGLYLHLMLHTWHKTKSLVPLDSRSIISERVNLRGHSYEDVDLAGRNILTSESLKMLGVSDKLTELCNEVTERNHRLLCDQLVKDPASLTSSDLKLMVSTGHKMPRFTLSQLMGPHSEVLLRNSRDSWVGCYKGKDFEVKAEAGVVKVVYTRCKDSRIHRGILRLIGERAHVEIKDPTFDLNTLMTVDFVINPHPDTSSAKVFYKSYEDETDEMSGKVFLYNQNYPITNNDHAKWMIEQCIEGDERVFVWMVLGLIPTSDFQVNFIMDRIRTSNPGIQNLLKIMGMELAATEDDSRAQLLESLAMLGDQQESGAEDCILTTESVGGSDDDHENFIDAVLREFGMLEGDDSESQMEDGNMLLGGYDLMEEDEFMKMVAEAPRRFGSRPEVNTRRFRTSGMIRASVRRILGEREKLRLLGVSQGASASWLHFFYVPPLPTRTFSSSDEEDPPSESDAA